MTTYKVIIPYKENKMSRTHRNPKHAVTETRVQYINWRIGYLRRYEWKFVITPYNQRRFELDCIAYKYELRDFYKSGMQPLHKRPVEPIIYAYKDRIVVEIDIDYDVEVAKLSAEYDKFTRDGHWQETSRNSQFKKHCAKDLRHKNKEILSKVLKDDESWEQQPFPDTYMGKHLIWDYW
jgi:hypothetical protein